MFDSPSLITRIAIGKAIGLIVGLVGFITLPMMAPDMDWMIRWGVLLWYPTVGAFIGALGVLTWHPILKLPMPWWFRAPWIGAWMNFVLIFFAYEKFQAMMEAMLGTSDDVWTSPFWLVLEGALVGLLIGYVATRLGGEGPDTVTELKAVQR